MLRDEQMRRRENCYLEIKPNQNIVIRRLKHVLVVFDYKARSHNALSSKTMGPIASVLKI